MIEAVDGRPHLEQARKVIAAGKILYIDKPVAGTLKDALEIYELAAKAGVPVFSSSSLRFAKRLDTWIARALVERHGPAADPGQLSRDRGLVVVGDGRRRLLQHLNQAAT